MIISTSAFTLMNALIKYLEGIPALELVFFRCLGSFVLCMGYLSYHRIPILGTHRGWLIARALVGGVAMSLFFLAIKALPFGSVVSLRYLSPIFAALFAMYLLREKVRPIQWFFFLLAFGGVLLLKGFDPQINLKGLSLIVGSAVLSGLVYVIIRKIGQREHPVVIVNYFMFIALLGSGLYSAFYWKAPKAEEWGILLFLGVLGFFGQWYMTRAFQIARASAIAPMKYLEVIFALLIGWSYFGESYSDVALLGIAMILIGMFCNLQVKAA